MAQIITNKAVAERCNLRAIEEGGSQANTVLASGEIWLVDSTNSSKGANGAGKYDKYIVGDGTTPASRLSVLTIDDLSGKQNILTFDSTPTEESQNPVTSAGIKTVLDTKANVADVYNKAQVDNMIVPHDSALVIVTALPATGAANTIYRKYTSGGSSYSDHMYVTGTGWIQLAEYDNEIDNTPLENSANLVKSGGVYSSQETLRTSLQGNIDTISGTVNTIQYSSTTLYAAFAYESPGHVIDARSASETYGQVIPGTETMCVTTFIPLMGATKIGVRAQITSSSAEVYDIAGMVAYNSNKEPVAVVQAISQGESATYENITWNVVSGAEYIRYSFTITNTNIVSLSPVQLIYEINSVLDTIKNDSLLLNEKISISTTAGGWVVNPSSSNYNKHISSVGNVRYATIDVTNIDYVGADFIHALKSTSYDQFGCLFVDENDAVIEVLTHSGTSSSTTDEANRYTVFKVPVGAKYLKATFYKTTNPDIYKYRKSSVTKGSPDLQTDVNNLNITTVEHTAEISNLNTLEYWDRRNITTNARYDRRGGMRWATSTASTSVFSSFVRTVEPTTGKRVRAKCVEPYLSTAAMQAGAISGTLLVCASSDSGNVVFYSMRTGARQYSSGMLADYSGHNNCAFFGTEKYVISDTYPLLYFTGDDMPIRAYRITGSIGSFQLTLVQTINIPSPQDTGYSATGATGAALHNGGLYIWNSSANLSDDTSRTLMRFPMPSLQDGDIVNLSISDREELVDGVYSIDFPISSYTQGAQVSGGVLYVPDYYGIVAVDLNSATYLGRLRLKDALSYEIESCFTYLDDWYVIAVNRTDEVTANNTVQIYYVELVES